MRNEGGIVGNLDWSVVLIYLILVTMGWFNIYASVYDAEAATSMFDFTINSGKQLLWIGLSVVLISIILIVDFRIYESLSPILYALFILLLMAVLVFGKTINGAKAWFEFGPLRFQPAELTKFATALLLARYLSLTGVKLSEFKYQVRAAAILLLPVGLILLQPDAGSAMVFAIFIIPMYREGFPGTIIVVGLVLITLLVTTYLVKVLPLVLVIFGIAALVFLIMKKTRKGIIMLLLTVVTACGLVYGADFFYTEVLKEYQRDRIDTILKPNQVDVRNEGWNLEQSKIAIGSGGFGGKGFLEGTQTKFGYVPEQSTDFIFSTLAEEHGWLGSLVLIGIFIVLLMRIVRIAERQKSKFSRVYAYSVASILFFHFTINLAMTIGLFPVVGIPLPFFSYGGSSLWSFTIMLFVLLKIDAHRTQVLTRG